MHKYFKRIKIRWQRSKRGWADSDAWNGDNYLAGVIAGMLEWHTTDQSSGVSMRYAYDLDVLNPDVDIMVQRRNAEYLKYAAIFREYAENGSWPTQKDVDDFGGALDKDLEEALQWFTTIFREFWD